MAGRRKKIVGVGVVGLGVAVISVAGVVFERPIREQWYLWKLKRGDDAEKRSAAQPREGN